MAKVLEWTVKGSIFLAVGISSVALLGPEGPVGERFASWRHEKRVEELLSARWTELAGTAGMGEADDTIVAVEFMDYQCPFCRRSFTAVRTLLKEHPHAKIAYRQFPLAIHAAAEGAARAALCADEQNRFPAMNEQLFTTDAWEESRDWTAQAVAADVPDLEEFRKCLRSARTTMRLRADSVLAVSLDVDGTPAFATRTAIRIGAMSEDTLARFLGLESDHVKIR